MWLMISEPKEDSRRRNVGQPDVRDLWKPESETGQPDPRGYFQNPQDGFSFGVPK
jgi:hypothetical protein